MKMKIAQEYARPTGIQSGIVTHYWTEVVISSKYRGDDYQKRARDDPKNSTSVEIEQELSLIRRR
jgi:hypothetical protein